MASEKFNVTIESDSDEEDIVADVVGPAAADPTTAASASSSSSSSSGGGGGGSNSNAEVERQSKEDTEGEEDQEGDAGKVEAQDLAEAEAEEEEGVFGSSDGTFGGVPDIQRDFICGPFDPLPGSPAHGVAVERAKAAAAADRRAEERRHKREAAFEKVGDNYCALCMRPLARDGVPTAKLPCSHVFHAECALKLS